MRYRLLAAWIEVCGSMIRGFTLQIIRLGFLLEDRSISGCNLELISRRQVKYGHRVALETFDCTQFALTIFILNVTLKETNRVLRIGMTYDHPFNAAAYLLI
jgi:hypothetical protein